MRHLPENAWKPGPDVQRIFRGNLKKLVFPIAPSPEIGKVLYAESPTKGTFSNRHLDDIVAVLTIALTIGIPMSCDIPLRPLLFPAVFLAALLWLGFHFAGRETYVVYVGEHGVHCRHDASEEHIIDFRTMAHLEFRVDANEYMRLKWYDMEDKPGPCLRRYDIEGVNEIQKVWGHYLADRLASYVESKSLKFPAIEEQGRYIELYPNTFIYHDNSQELTCSIDVVRLDYHEIVMEAVDGTGKPFRVPASDFIDGYAIPELAQVLKGIRTAAATSGEKSLATA